MFFQLSERSCCLAVGEIEREFDAPTPCIEIAITIAIWCAVEALRDEVSDICPIVDVAFLLQLSEVESIHDKQLDSRRRTLGSGGWHDIVAFSSLSMSLVGFLDCFPVSKIVNELFEWVVHKT